jgi:GAF domain-containing protein
MPAAPLPPNETERIAALHALNILDTPPEERFDRLTRITRRAFHVPIALVSMVDTSRQWFKSSGGLSFCETSRDISFCAYAILDEDILHVENATKDERFSDNPAVKGEPKIRFYAGCPLRVNSFKMGTLCIVDRKPRLFTEEDRQLLRDLAAIVEQELIRSPPS